MNTLNTQLPFDLTVATAHLSAIDPALAKLILEMRPFEPEIDHTQSPYEALMEAIVYQSISGKAAATIFERVKALSDGGGASSGISRRRTLAGTILDKTPAVSGRVPAPEEVLKLSKQKLR